MILMQLNGISKSFGAEEILSNIKLEIKDRDRVAIVGRNGAGKSTLLKIMAGELTYDDGQLMKPKDVTLGYLSQHIGLESNLSIWEEMLEVFDHLIAQEKQLRAVEAEMTDAAALSSDNYEKLLETYDNLQQTFELSGGYHYESDIRSVLTGLHFQDYDYNTAINELSGGQKTRLALGKLLLKKPHLLILDEPTNHLDIETLGWLENYLVSYPGAVTIVSHDRYFLDKTVSIVYEVSRHKTKKFIGSYSAFLDQKAIDYEKDLKEFEKQQNEIKKTEEFIQRNIVRASTTKRAQSRRKQLDKLDRIDRPLGDESSASFSFKVKKRSGNDVLKINDVTFGYDGEAEDLFSHITFHGNRGDRIALVGPNGVGKTTLLKVIMGRFKQKEGTIKLGTNVEIGYYDQEQTNLTSSKTVLKELWDDFPNVDEKDIRTVLGNFLFSGDDVLKTVHSLSGGEKARVALAKLMMQQANLLILDEPTNHLDIDSKEVLEAALLDFPGTIIFVSHDRYFINKITDEVVEMSRDGAKVYLGDYDYYVDKKQEEADILELEQQQQVKVVEQPNERRLSFKEEKQLQSEQRKRERQIAELEANIELLELEHAEIEAEMTKPEIFGDHEKALEFTNKANEMQLQINQQIEAWTALLEEA